MRPGLLSLLQREAHLQRENETRFRMDIRVALQPAIDTHVKDYLGCDTVFLLSEGRSRTLDYSHGRNVATAANRERHPTLPYLQPEGIQSDIQVFIFLA